MNQAYEMMYILRSNLLEEQISSTVGKYRNLLTEHGATNIQIKLWGKRRLAYPIQKHQEGIYILMNYEGDGKQIAVVERAMRLSEEVIRYLTIKIKEAPTVSEDSFKDFTHPSFQTTEVKQQPSQPAPEVAIPVISKPTEDDQPSQPVPEGIAPISTNAKDTDEQPSQPKVEETTAIAPEVALETETADESVEA